MSIAVDLSDVERTAAGFPVAYLLTAGDGGRVHLLAVTPRFGEQAIAIGGVGRHTAANVQRSGRATLLWSPATATDYSLIVDGDATVDVTSGDAADGAADSGAGAPPSAPATPAVVTIVPTKAILHRPAVDVAGQRVGNDCVEIPPPE